MSVEITTEIEINASAAEVWKVLTDLRGWQDWNPFITVAGKPEVGSRLLVEITPPGKSSMKFSPTVQVVEPNRKFEWLGRVFFAGIFDGHHSFHLEEDNGKTRFLHFETFTGLLAKPIMGKQAAATELGFRAMNRALKKRVERKG